MTNASAMRLAYVQNSVDTMAPGRLIVALYDRLILDLDRARTMVNGGDLGAAHECLIHAQEIVAQLHDSLDLEKWPPARALADIYLFVYNELITANVQKSTERIESCRDLLSPLREAWYEAAGTVPSGQANGSR